MPKLSYSRTWTCGACGLECHIFSRGKSFPGQERSETSLTCPRCRKRSTSEWSPDTTRPEIHIADRVPAHLRSTIPRTPAKLSETVAGMCLGIVVVVIGALALYWLQ